MNVLIIKMSSLGDVIHTLPAVTDAVKALDDIQFDWVVESGFQEIPRWHPAVRQVIPIELRHWRKNKRDALMSGSVKHFIQQLRYREYDVILDAQGLLKSACVARLARGIRIGLDKKSAREPVSSVFYQKTVSAGKNQHAVEKVRQLFAKALNYSLPTPEVNYGIDIARLGNMLLPKQPYVMFLHGTTWATKHWPEQYWCELAKKLCSEGQQVVLTWGNQIEKARAEKIVYFCQQQKLNLTPHILPKLSLGEITYVIANATAAVAVDTGLGHIAAMMNVPTLSLYGPTFPGFTGAYGQQQIHLTVDAQCHPCFEKECPIAKGSRSSLYPPCFKTLTPQSVWQQLESMLIDSKRKTDVIHG